jgi:hypothetical protein
MASIRDRRQALFTERLLFGGIAWWFFAPMRPVEMEAGETVFLPPDPRHDRTGD